MVICWCLLFNWISILFVLMDWSGIKWIFLILFEIGEKSVIECMVFVFLMVFILCVLCIKVIGWVIISFVCWLFIYWLKFGVLVIVSVR